MATSHSETFLTRGYRARLLMVLMFVNTLNFADRAILPAARTIHKAMIAGEAASGAVPVGR